MTDAYEMIAQSLFAKVKNGDATGREVRLAEAIRDAHSKGTPIDAFSFGLSMFESGILSQRDDGGGYTFAIPCTMLDTMCSPEAPADGNPSLPNRAMRRDMARRLKQLRSQ